MDKLEQTIKDIELGLRIAKGTDCGLFKTSVKSAEQILELLKEKQPRAVKNVHYFGDIALGDCPSCGDRVLKASCPNFCGKCGDRIDWTKDGENNEVN